MTEHPGVERRAFLHLAAGSTLLAIVAITGMSSLSGCGGSGSGTRDNERLVVGTARLSVEWAARLPGRKVASGLAAYLMVDVIQHYSRGERHQTFGPFNRPEGDGPVTSVVTLENVLAGDVNITFLTYPDEPASNLNGMPLGRGNVQINIPEGGTASIVVAKYLESRVERIAVIGPENNDVAATSEEISLTVGEEKTFLAQPLSGPASTLLVSPTQLLWSTKSKAISLFGSTGVWNAVRGVSVSGGREQVTVREIESGKTASFYVKVLPAE